MSASAAAFTLPPFNYAHCARRDAMRLPDELPPFSYEPCALRDAMPAFDAYAICLLSFRFLFFSLFYTESFFIFVCHATALPRLAAASQDLIHASEQLLSPMFFIEPDACAALAPILCHAS